jgi:hypothetical protein
MNEISKVKFAELSEYLEGNSPKSEVQITVSETTETKCLMFFLLSIYRRLRNELKAKLQVSSNSSQASSTSNPPNPPQASSTSNPPNSP